MDTCKLTSYYLKTLILFLFPIMMDTQRITCPTACDMGYTCAMVRHDRRPPTPGCISMQEAIMLHQALTGGPSGPGTGRTVQDSTGFPQPGMPQMFPQNQRPGDPIPGINFLGGAAPQQPQNFEQRFEQGLGRQQQNFINPPGMLGQQGMFGMQGVPGGVPGMPGMPGMPRAPGQFGSTQGTFGMNGPAFLDPTAGQFGPAGVGVGSQTLGFRPRLDGGHSHTSLTDNNSGRNNIAQHDSNNGVGSRSESIPPPNTRFPGEPLPPEIKLASQTNSLSDAPNGVLNNVPDGFIGFGDSNSIVGTSNSAFNTAITNSETLGLSNVLMDNQMVPQGISQVPVKTPPEVITEPQVPVDNKPAIISSLGNINLKKQRNTEGQVSIIMEDSSGLHYFFFPTPRSAGLRVNITKSGFCQRKSVTRESDFCMNACYSDLQCPYDHKCCPNGCSLECSIPPSLGLDNETQPQEETPAPSVPAIEARCIQCQSHLDCNSQDQFCTMSTYCGQAMVCKQVTRR